MSKVEELRVKTIDLMSDPNMPVSLEYATELIGFLIAAARAEGNAEAMAGMLKDVIPHCADCIQAWSMGIKHTIDFSLLSPAPKEKK